MASASPLAARWGRAALAGLLLGGALCLSLVGTARADDPGAALIEAARTKNHEAALALLAQRADARARRSDGTTALHWAAHNGDLELVRRLLPPARIRRR